MWTPAQLRAFLNTARQHRLFAFYRLAAYTGARRGELLNLRWRDIDLDLGEVRITGSAAVIAGQRIEGTTKSGRSRTVSIDAETVQVLRDHRKHQAGEIAAAQARQTSRPCPEQPGQAGRPGLRASPSSASPAAGDGRGHRRRYRRNSPR